MYSLPRTVVIDDESPPPLPGNCLNCATPLQGPYCRECGQRDFDFRQSFWRMVIDTLEQLLHLDGRFSQSVISLLFRPGRLTLAFLNGRRASQVPPLRFYLFVSLVFFLSLPLRGNFNWQVPTLPAELNTAADELSIPEDQSPVAVLNEVLTGIRDGVDIANDQEMASQSEEEQRLVRIVTKLRDRFSNPGDFIDFLLRHAPNFIFFSLPIIALMLRVLFRSARRTYLENLVVALHLGSFYFTYILVTEGWDLLLGLVYEPLRAIFSFVAVVYAIAFTPWFLYRVFKRGVWGTIWRTTIFWMAGFFLFMSTFAAATAYYAVT